MPQLWLDYGRSVLTPKQLRLGKVFHKLIQDEWKREAEGDVQPEHHVTKPNGRRGRVDVFVNDEDPDSPIAILEVKATDWDKIAEKNLRRNVQRQIRQVWSYIEAQIRGGEYVKGGAGKDVCPGILFPKRPKTKGRLELIEEMFGEEGIAVVWHDESIEECKNRKTAGDGEGKTPSPFGYSPLKKGGELCREKQIETVRGILEEQIAYKPA